MAPKQVPEAAPAPPPAASRSSWARPLVLIVITVAIVVVGLLGRYIGLLPAWVMTMVLLALFAAVVGDLITGRWSGVLISSRSMYSLSQLQIVLWTIVILAAFLAAVLTNLASGEPRPLSVAIPPEMWLVLGISTTSLVGTPLMLSTRTSRPITPDQKVKLSAKPAAANLAPAESPVVENKSTGHAAMVDIFRGEEVGNFQFVDVSKLQMFFFTLILLTVYAVIVGDSLATHTAIHQLPALDKSFVALLGISHAGYLTSKAVPHTPAAAG